MIEYKTVVYEGQKNDPKFTAFLNKWGKDNWEVESMNEKQAHYPSTDIMGVAYPTRTRAVVECMFKKHT